MTKDDAQRITRNPVVVIPASVLVTALGLTGAYKVAGPGDDMQQAVTRLETKATSVDEGIGKLNDKFDRLIDLYADNAASIRVLNNRVDRAEGDIEKVEDDIKGVRNTIHNYHSSPFPQANP